MRTIILSDCHIGNSASDVAKLNLFLRHAECNRLILAGNIFDFCEINPAEIKRQFATTIGLIRKLSTDIRVDYITGKTDAQLLEQPMFCRGEVKTAAQARVLTPDGRMFYVCHGSVFESVIDRAATLLGLQRVAGPELLRKRAAKSCLKKGYQGVIMGHEPGEWKRDGMEVYCGSWLTDRSYVLVEGSSINIMRI